MGFYSIRETIYHFTLLSRFSAQILPQEREPTKDSDNYGCLTAQEEESPGSDTTSCPDSDPDSDMTVDYTETHSPSPEHWPLSATQDFSGAIER